MDRLLPIHPFPARMAPELALQFVDALPANSVLLDPMAGSGTSMIAGRRRGVVSLGFDLDPLAVSISHVSCSNIDATRLLKAARGVLERASSVDHRTLKMYPAGCDDETKEFIRYWFDASNRKELTALSAAIGRVRDRDIRMALFVALSRMIIVKERGVSLAMDVAHSRPHRVYDLSPVSAFEDFIPSVLRLTGRIESLRPFRNARWEIQWGDARRLPIAPRSVDAIITSPPYLNAIDYMRGHRLSLVWMGYSLSQLRAMRGTQVGAERCASAGGGDLQIIHEEMPDLSAREQGFIKNYIADMGRVVAQASRVLRPGGSALFVVADSSLRGELIRNSSIVTKLAERRRLELVEAWERQIPQNRRYLPPPSRSRYISPFRKRMSVEWVLKFNKNER